MEDPHLIRLGHYLEHLEGPEEVARLLNDGVDMEELEKAFLEEPWKAGLSIVRVVDPTGRVKPFVQVENTKEKDHQHCPFFTYTRLCQQISEETDKKPEEPRKEIVGFSLDAKDVVLPKFKSWEKKERGGELRTMFKWKVSTHNQTDQQNKTEESKTTSTKKTGSSSKANQGSGKVTKAILKVLMKTGRPKTSQRDFIVGPAVITWSGSRDIATEQMQVRKVNRRVEKKPNNNKVQGGSKEVSDLYLSAMKNSIDGKMFWC